MWVALSAAWWAAKSAVQKVEKTAASMADWMVVGWVALMVE